MATEFENFINTLAAENKKEGVIANIKAYENEFKDTPIYAGKPIDYHGFEYMYDKETGNLTVKNITYATIEIVNVGNIPKAKLSFIKEVETFRSYKTVHRYLNDWLKYGTISMQYLVDGMPDLLIKFKGNKDFIELKAKNMVFAENSIEHFYGYMIGNKMEYFVDLTPKRIEKWWDYDCPYLYRYDINKMSCYNSYGCCFPIWEDCIVESCYTGFDPSLSGVTLSKDITEDEFNAIIKDRNNFFSDMIKRKYDRLRNPISNEEREKIKAEVQKKIDEIQALINDKTAYIVNQVYNKMGGSSPYLDTESKKSWIYRNEDRYGFDCGLCNYRFEDRTLFEKMKDIGEHLYFRLPIEVQSTTIQRFQAEAVKTLINSNSLEKIGYSIALD